MDEMARPHYHRDLVTTVLALAGTALLVGAPLARFDWMGPVVFGVGVVLSTFVIACALEGVTVGETALAAAVILLLLAGAHRANIGTLSIPRLGGVVVAGMGCAALGTCLARWSHARWRPRAVIAGAIGIGAVMLTVIVVFTVHGRVTGDVAAGLAIGAMGIGGALAVLLVPGVRPRDVYGGQLVLLSAVIVISSGFVKGDVRQAAFGVVGCTVIAAAGALGAHVATVLRDRRTPPPEVPEARLR